jgi:hypothetical protein
MRKVLLALLLVAGLVFPASALAHHDYHNVTLNGNPWSNTSVSVGFTQLSCWEATLLGPGETRYIASPDRIHYGLGVITHYWDHVHPLNAFDNVTGPETRQFGAAGVTVGTRRVWHASGGGVGLTSIKFVHQGGSTHAVIRANC